MATQTPKPASPALPLSVKVYITQKNGMPAVELRTLTTDVPIVKRLISCAIHEQPVVIMPMFTDKIKSLASCIDKGILHTKEDEFFFNI